MTRKQPIGLTASLLCWLLCGLPALPQETVQVAGDDSSGIERLCPLEPSEAANTFTVLHGFRLDLIAHEPLLRDPVAIAYDENGSMYAVEMTAYPHPERAADQALGRVRLLSDATVMVSSIQVPCLPTGFRRRPASPAGRVVSSSLHHRNCGI